MVSGGPGYSTRDCLAREVMSRYYAGQAMDNWKPKLRPGLNFTLLNLDREEGYLCSRIDGATSVKQLTQVTGIPPERIREILAFLFRQGALEGKGIPDEVAGRSDQDSEMEIVRDRHELLMPPSTDQTTDSESSGLPDWLIVEGHSSLPDKAEERVIEDAGKKKTEKPKKPAKPVEPVMLKEFEESEEMEVAAAGVEQRLLLRNPKISDATYRKVLGTMSMPEVYRQIASREATERVKRNARRTLREKYQRSSPEEHLDIILTTEGQCLSELPGLHLDEETTTLLHELTYDSLLLVKNLGKFPATPPKLIKHLLGQKTVRESIELTNLLKRHPKCPKELKKKKY